MSIHLQRFFCCSDILSKCILCTRGLNSHQLTTQGRDRDSDIITSNDGIGPIAQWSIATFILFIYLYFGHGRYLPNIYGRNITDLNTLEIE